MFKRFSTFSSQDSTLSHLQTLPMPQSFVLLGCASMLGAFLVFILSMLDMGRFSFWVSPPVALVTLIYHIGVFILAHRKRDRLKACPSYYSTVVITAYIVALGWLVALITTSVVIAQGNTVIEDLREAGLVANIQSQWAQWFFALCELMIVGGVAVRGHLLAMRNGEPESWRRQNEKQPERDTIDDL